MNILNIFGHSRYLKYLILINENINTFDKLTKFRNKNKTLFQEWKCGKVANNVIKMQIERLITEGIVKKAEKRNTQKEKTLTINYKRLLECLLDEKIKEYKNNFLKYNFVCEKYKEGKTKWEKIKLDFSPMPNSSKNIQQDIDFLNDCKKEILSLPNIDMDITIKFKSALHWLYLRWAKHKELDMIYSLNDVFESMLYHVYYIYNYFKNVDENEISNVLPANKDFLETLKGFVEQYYRPPYFADEVLAGAGESIFALKYYGEEKEEK